jgi:hypothetical protein
MAGKEMFRWPHYIVRASSSTRSGGSSGGLEERTNGCFSTIRNGAKHTPKRSHTAPTAACNLSAGTSTWLRARDNWFPRRPPLGSTVNGGRSPGSAGVCPLPPHLPVLIVNTFRPAIPLLAGYPGWTGSRRRGAAVSRPERVGLGI